MKIRTGFVSNSSSSSFVISKYILSAIQVDKIYNHINIDDEEFDSQCGQPIDSKYRELNFPWTITQTEHEIRGSVFMDNFDMKNFLEAIGVKEKGISWGTRMY